MLCHLNRQMQALFKGNLPLLIRLPLRANLLICLLLLRSILQHGSNCVDVEMAIKNIADQENIKLHVHRSIGETQDPFGTDGLTKMGKPL